MMGLIPMPSLSVLVAGVAAIGAVRADFCAGIGDDARNCEGLALLQLSAQRTPTAKSESSWPFGWGRDSSDDAAEAAASVVENTATVAENVAETATSVKAAAEAANKNTAQGVEAAEQAVNEAVADAKVAWTKPTQKRNVLFFLVDDLRPNLGAYNWSVNARTLTPHMDWLATEGLTFSRAYANYPWCAPSRNSMLSGRLPDHTRDFNFADHFREKGIGEDWRSMPQYFKEQGYETAVSGKFFHKMKPPNNDYPKSWTMKPFTPLCAGGYPKSDCPDSTAHFASSAHKFYGCSKEGSSWCAMNMSKDEERDDHQLEDQRIASSCVQQIWDVTKKNSNFFIACGFHKPHPPWVFPEEFLNMLPDNPLDIPLAAPEVQGSPEGMPKAAFHGLMDIKMTQHMVRNGVKSKLTEEEEHHYIRRAYYASVAYTDYNIGKVLEALKKTGKMQDTAIVVTSDHGWHLGEQGMWGKMTNYETALRVPLIVHAPWIPESKGRVTDTLAELIDIYPTLADITGLPHPHDIGESVDGTSLMPIFFDASPDAARNAKVLALSQVAKPSKAMPDKISVAMHRNEMEIMGYSIRTHNWRYTAWFQFDRWNQVPRYDKEFGRELYDHSDDSNVYSWSGNGGFDSCQEMVNLAQLPNGERRSSNKADVNYLHDMLLKQIKLKPSHGEWFKPSEGWIIAMRGPMDDDRHVNKSVLHVHPGHEFVEMSSNVTA